MPPQERHIVGLQFRPRESWMLRMILFVLQFYVIVTLRVLCIILNLPIFMRYGWIWTASDFWPYWKTTYVVVIKIAMEIPPGSWRLSTQAWTTRLFNFVINFGPFPNSQPPSTLTVFSTSPVPPHPTKKVQLPEPITTRLISLATFCTLLPHISSTPLLSLQTPNTPSHADSYIKQIIIESSLKIITHAPTRSITLLTQSQLCYDPPSNPRLHRPHKKIFNVMNPTIHNSKSSKKNFLTRPDPNFPTPSLKILT